MELKDFIKETLSQIIDAVSETQEKYKPKIRKQSQWQSQLQ